MANKANKAYEANKDLQIFSYFCLFVCLFSFLLPDAFFLPFYLFFSFTCFGLLEMWLRPPLVALIHHIFLSLSLFIPFFSFLFHILFFLSVFLSYFLFFSCSLFFFLAHFLTYFLSLYFFSFLPLTLQMFPLVLSVMVANQVNLDEKWHKHQHVKQQQHSNDKNSKAMCITHLHNVPTERAQG